MTCRSARIDSRSTAQTRTARLAKLPEGPLHLRDQVHIGFAMPAQVRLIKRRAIQGSRQVAAPGIAAVGLSLRKLFAQRGYPAAHRAEKAPPKIRLLEHQPQRFTGVASIVYLFLHHGKNGIFQGGQRVSIPGRFGKSLRDKLPEVLNAEREQILFVVKITKKCAPGNSRLLADVFDCSPVEADGGKQFPRYPLDLPQNELMFPITKRLGMSRFRPFFAAGSRNRFMHWMQIMAQGAVL